jgi:Holliday junction resolvasome RuvABC endonuclease subunit
MTPLDLDSGALRLTDRSAPGEARPRILALDCGTRTGYAHNCRGGAIESGFRDFPLRRGSSAGMRFLEFRRWLRDLIDDLQPEIVVYERPERFQSGAAVELCVGFMTRVQEVAAGYDAEYCAVGPKRLKKFATGNGNAAKDAMARAANEYFDNADAGEITDHNEADAVLLLAFALEGFPEPEKPKRGGSRRKSVDAADGAVRALGGDAGGGGKRGRVGWASAKKETTG